MEYKSTAFQRLGSLSFCYDYGLEGALLGDDFTARARELAVGCTNSDAYAARYDALERGYAEGVRIANKLGTRGEWTV
jgi:hypothetical protein